MIFKQKGHISLNVRILSFLIIAIPLFEPYSFNGVSLDSLLFFSIVVYSCMFSSKVLKNPLLIKPFFIYALIIPNLSAIAFGYSNHLISSITVVAIYWLCIHKVFPQLCLVQMLKYYKYIVWLSCAVFLCQEVMYSVLGYRFSALIPYFDLKYSDVSMASFIQKQMFYERSSSFFLEPSHLAQFIIPYLAIILGKNHNAFSLKAYIQPLILTSILFILRSGCGLVCAGLIWIFYILSIRLDLIKKVIFVTISVLAIVICFQYLAATEIGEFLIRRSSEFDASASYERSGVIRVIRGFLVFDSMDLVQQLFGVGTGGSIDVVNNSPYLYMFFGEERYLNNIQTLLIGFGIVGTFLFFIHLCRLYRDNTLAAKLILISFIGMSFLDSFFMNSKMTLYMAFVVMFKLSMSKLNDLISNDKW